MSNSKPLKVFISYSGKNKVIAKKLASALLINGINVWLDDWEILVGHNIYDSVYKGILSCDYLVIILTAESLKSRWVHEELSISRQLELEENKVVILPLVFQKLELPINLRMSKYANFINWNKGFFELFTFFKTVSPALSNNHFDYKILSDIKKKLKDKTEQNIIHENRNITSQAAARIVSETSIHLNKVDNFTEEDVTDCQTKLNTIIIDMPTIGQRLPIVVDFAAKSAYVLANILKILQINEIIDKKHISYFLIYNNIPIDLDETLIEAGVLKGDIVNIGAYNYFIE